MSALGTRPSASSRYHQTKYKAEQAVKRSGLAWTIFRPSLIHGPDGEFMLMVKDMLARGILKGGLPFMPFFGKGSFGQEQGLVQPVFVEDVARVFIDAIENDQTIGQTYDVAGPERMKWSELYALCQKYIPNAKSKKSFGIPAWFAKRVVGVAESVGCRCLPFDADQVVMATEDNVASDASMRRLDETFNLHRTGFAAALEKYGANIYKSN